MGDLKKQLRELQGEYQSLEYPGDLAVDVLGKPSANAAGGGWMKLAVGIAAAVALGGLVWVGLDRPAKEQVASDPPVTTTNEQVAVVESTEDSIPTLIAAKPEAAPTQVERPTWASIHESEEDARPSFSSIGSLSVPYQSFTLPTLSEVQQAREQQEQANRETAG